MDKIAYRIENMRSELLTACGGKRAYRVTHEDIMKKSGGHPHKLLEIASDKRYAPKERSMALLCYHETADSSDRPHLTHEEAKGSTRRIGEILRINTKEKSNAKK